MVYNGSWFGRYFPVQDSVVVFGRAVASARPRANGICHSFIHVGFSNRLFRIFAFQLEEVARGLRSRPAALGITISNKFDCSALICTKIDFGQVRLH